MNNALDAGMHKEREIVDSAISIQRIVRLGEIYFETSSWN